MPAAPAAADARARRDYRRGRLTDWQRDRIDAGGDLPRVGEFRPLARLGPRTLAAVDPHGRPVVLKDCGDGEVDPLEHLTGVSLRHAAVVKPSKYFLHDGVTWAVAPRVAGPTLAGAVAARGRWEPADGLRLARTLAAGLAAAEAAGLIHGGVHAGNVRLTRSGPVLVDAGLAPLLPPRDGTAGRGGWAEPTDGPPAFSTAADLRAFAATVWGVLAGRPPFLLAAPRLGTVDAARPAVPPVRDLAPDTPDRLANLLDGLLGGVGDPPASFAEVVRRLAPPRPRASPVRTGAWLIACGFAGAGILGAAGAPGPVPGEPPEPAEVAVPPESVAEPVAPPAVRRVAIPGLGR